MMLPSAWIAALGAEKFSLFFIVAKSEFQSHLSPPGTIAPHASTSSFDGRTAYRPFTADDPPSTFPRGHEIARSAAFGCCTVV